MSKLLGALIIVALLFGGYKLFEYWNRVSLEKDTPKVELTGDMLPGMDSKISQSYQQARQGGASVLKKWLDQHASSSELQDPRKAWIQLDYVIMVARENPAEARRLFAEVKARVDSSSKVYPRVQKLAPTYD